MRRPVPSAGRPIGRRAVATGGLLATTVGLVPVLNATFGLFLLPMAATLHWPRARVSLLLAAVAVASAASLPVAGRIADRFGVRATALIGNALFAISVAALSRSGPVVWQTMALFACAGLASSGPSAMLYAKLVSGWFEAGRGLMLGLVGGVGNGIGCTLMPLLAAAAIARWGWREAYVVLAIAVLLRGQLALGSLVRDPQRRPAARPADGGLEADGMTLGAAMRTGRFWALLGIMVLGAASLTALFSHIVPLLTGRGLGIGLAASAVSVTALVGSGWQLLLGTLLDRGMRPLVMAPLFLSAIAGMALLAGAGGPGTAIAGAVLVGLAIGTDYGAVPLLVGRYFGLRRYGAISGLIFGVNALAVGCAPFLADLAWDRTGSYRAALVGVALCLVACAALCATLPALPRAPGRPERIVMQTSRPSAPPGC